MLESSIPNNDQSSSPGTRKQGDWGLTSDFSPIASKYDATRELPEEYLVACYDRLLQCGLFPPQGSILDAGCGTGQVSLPLAAQGYAVRGIDISKEMITLAQSKVRLDWRAQYTVGDVRRIPAGNASFDAVVLSKLFQHVQDWRDACRELIRVVRPRSYIVQINERGAFSNSIRRYFSRRANELGFTGRYLGVDPHSSGELASFMASQGCQPIPVDMSDLRWDIAIGYGDAINRIQDRLFAEFWYFPNDVYDRLIAETLAWIEAQPAGRNTIEHLKPYLVVEVFRTGASC